MNFKQLFALFVVLMAVSVPLAVNKAWAQAADSTSVQTPKAVVKPAAQPATKPAAAQPAPKQVKEPAVKETAQKATEQTTAKPAEQPAEKVSGQESKPAPETKMSAEVAPKAPMETLKTVEDVLSKYSELSDFADLVKSADVEKDLSGKGVVVTLFAPTNKAMGKIPGDVMKRIKAEKDGLRSFVLYHTITGSRMSSGSIKGRKIGLGSGAGEMLMFDGTGDKLLVGDAEIITPDIMTTDSIVHIVQGPIIPPHFLQAAPATAGTSESAAAAPKGAMPELPGSPSQSTESGMGTIEKAILLFVLLALAFLAGLKVGARGRQ